MYRFKHFVLSILFAWISIFAYPAQISETKALEKAQQFYAQNKQSLLRTATDFQLIHTGTTHTTDLRSVGSTIYYYIFNVTDQQGFVIVSGDDRTKPILGYSNEGSFSAENMPDNLKNWLNFYQSEISYVMEADFAQTPQTSASTDTKTFTATVNPLLGNIKWNQGDPFNLLCPFDVTENERTVTGCVATAVAQIMNYYKWPLTGTSAHSYESVRYGTLQADFSKTNYNWDNMLDSYGVSTSTTQDSAVAKLMYHVGVSVDMDYNVPSKGGSAAYDKSAALALINYFGYDADIQYYPRSFYTSAQWSDLIKAELNASRPVFYGGSSIEAGHAFVCDGYDANNLFHINWGWGGMSNGYFELSSLKPTSSGIGGSTGGYTQNQSIIAGIQKPDGINLTQHQIGMHTKGLSSSVSSISSITKNTFTLNFGFGNFGINDYTGKIGIGLYKNGVFQKIIQNSTTITIGSFNGSASYSFTNLSLSGIAEGNYQLVCTFLPSGATTWQPFKGNSSLNNYVNVVVTGLSATLLKPETAPSLLLTQIQQSGNSYKNREASFNVTVQNTGLEFFSEMGVKIYSATNPSVFQYLHGITFLSSGETKTMNFSGNITCAPGLYYAVAVFDSTNNASEMTFKVMESGDSEPLSVTILEEPTAAVLNLTDAINLPNGSTVYKNELITLNASIQNSGGYFNSEVNAFVFPETWGNSVGQLNSKNASIETNQTQTISLTGALDLDPGTYHFVLYKNTGNWFQFSPETYSIIDFRLEERISGLGNESTTGLFVYPNPVTDLLNIHSSDEIKQADILDLSGSLILRVQNSKTVPVYHLKPGVYFLRVDTENGIKILKFIKK